MSKRPARSARNDRSPSAKSAKATTGGIESVAKPDEQDGPRDAADPETRHRMIREMAYALYVQRGCVHGFADHDWLAAEAHVDRTLRDRAGDEPG